jgi:hypothetical protein
MSEKPQTEEFDDDEDDAVAPGDDEGDGDVRNFDRLINDLDTRKKAGPKPGEPAWRRLERRREERETAALLSDIDDYEIGDDEDGMKRKRR